jgi:hypothetical protein
MSLMTNWLLKVTEEKARNRSFQLLISFTLVPEISIVEISFLRMLKIARNALFGHYTLVYELSFSFPQVPL